METNASLAAAPRLAFTTGDEDFARHWVHGHAPGGPFAVIHAGASGRGKRWPAAGFADVARRLADDCGLLVVLSEGPLDAAANKELMAACPRLDPRCLVVENLRRLAAVLARATLVVANDSGVAHLAAAAGAPVVAIFQAADPRLWAPRGSRVCPLVRPSAAEVVAAARNLIEERNKS